MSEIDDAIERISEQIHGRHFSTWDLIQTRLDEQQHADRTYFLECVRAEMEGMLPTPEPTPEPMPDPMYPFELKRPSIPESCHTFSGSLGFWSCGLLDADYAKSFRMRDLTIDTGGVAYDSAMHMAGIYDVKGLRVIGGKHAIRMVAVYDSDFVGLTLAGEPTNLGQDIKLTNSPKEYGLPATNNIRILGLIASKHLRIGPINSTYDHDKPFHIVLEDAQIKCPYVNSAIGVCGKNVLIRKVVLDFRDWPGDWCYGVSIVAVGAQRPEKVWLEDVTCLVRESQKKHAVPFIDPYGAVESAQSVRVVT